MTNCECLLKALFFEASPIIHQQTYPQLATHCRSALSAFGEQQQIARGQGRRAERAETHGIPLFL
jgi:hypothetical protein